MLTKELRDLEKHRIVLRKAYPTIPPTVEYSLTEKGREFEPILLALQEWGLKHID
jgi:DNA-binding HxlR family transcriptional regulator